MCDFGSDCSSVELCFLLHQCGTLVLIAAVWDFGSTCISVGLWFYLHQCWTLVLIAPLLDFGSDCTSVDFGSNYTRT